MEKLLTSDAFNILLVSMIELEYLYLVEVYFCDSRIKHILSHSAFKCQHLTSHNITFMRSESLPEYRKKKLLSLFLTCLHLWFMLWACGLAKSHWQTSLLTFTSTHCLVSLLTIRGVTHLVVHSTSGCTRPTSRCI